MRLELALPILASAASVSAQGINFSKVFSAKPELSTFQPTSTKSIDRAATASSIVSALSASHAKTKLAAATTFQSAPKPTATSKAVGSAEPTKSAKPSSSAKTSSLKSSSKPSSKPGSKPSSAPLVKRDGNCAAQNVTYGYQPTPNTPTAFLTDTNLINQAVVAIQPPGFTKLFAGLTGSMYAGNYITYYPLATYSPQACSDICTLTAGCKSFNLYFERDPMQDPNTARCPNPTAATAVRCALWGSSIATAQAKNIGEYRADFMVVIAGSNGYSKNTAPSAISGFTGPTAFSGLVNVATINGKSVAVGDSFYPGTSYNPQQCTDLCLSTNVANRAAAVVSFLPSYNVCSYANAALLSIGGVVQGTYCALYNDAGVVNYATLVQQTYNTVAYDISYSYGYGLNSTDKGLTGITTTARTTTTSASTTASTTAVTTTSSTASTTTRSLSAATPTGVSCAGLGGLSYTDLNGISYQTKCGYDLLGTGDIANARVGAYSDCFTLCDVTPGCDGFAFVPSANWCYMKRLTGITTLPNRNTGVDLAWLPNKYTDLSPPATTTSATTSATTTLRTTTSATTTTR